MANYVELTRAAGEAVCRCRVADSFAARFRGLMGAAQLPRGSGLLLPRTSSVHTHFMRFPIDVVFLDRAGKVVGLREAMPPNRPFAGARRAYRTIELPAGTVKQSGTARDDRLRFET